MSKQHSILRISKMVAATMAAAIMFVGFTFVSNAESTGTVTVDSAKVRSSASTTADTVGTAASGSSVTISDETTDSSGNVWYHVTLSDGTTGYIRSDLLSVTETAAEAPAADETTADASADVASAGAASTVVDGIDVAAIIVPDGVEATGYTKATVNVATGKVRSDASTNDSIVAQLSQGTPMVIAGNKLGSDSKTWYYTAFLDGGSQKTGFIRSDLVQTGDVIVIEAPVEETAPEEEIAEPEPVPEVNNDYELVFTDDGTGTNVWYLYNHIDNTREKLQELLDFADAQQGKQQAYQDTIKKLKLVAIVLGVLLALAIVAIIVLAIKSRSYDYEEYEDDDDEDDDDEDEDDEDEEEDEEEEEEYVAPAPRRRRPTSNASAAPRRPVTYTEEPKVAAPEKKKPKNFMLDDDDFEFEFLNMDDK